MAKGSGVNTSAAKKAHNEVKTAYESLKNNLNNLQKDLELLNKEYWHGGKKAFSWYKANDDNISDLKRFSKGVNKFQEDLHDVYRKTKNYDF